MVAALPDDLAGITLSRKLEEVVADCGAVVVCTEWPEIREADWAAILVNSKDLLFVDANGFLATAVGNRTGVIYRQVGKPKKTSRQDLESHAKTQRRQD
jgi:UDPglucose 6-dehydrogenase